MTGTRAEQHAIIDEDLQILRVTLETISPEVQQYSPASAAALKSAANTIEAARQRYLLETSAR